MIQKLISATLISASLVLAGSATGQSYFCEKDFQLEDAQTDCLKFGPSAPPTVFDDPEPPPAVPVPVSPLRLRIEKYASLALQHRLCGLASYYSASLDGTLTANGERYHQKQLSAAHLTLPLGTWIEVTARATGRKIRCRVNDRGPYAQKFILDLSYKAAHELGVDEAEDRHIDIRIVALPGEEPLPESLDWSFDEETTVASSR